jgi:hypothetical protein
VAAGDCPSRYHADVPAATNRLPGASRVAASERGQIGQLLVRSVASWPDRPEPPAAGVVARADLARLVTAAIYHSIEPAVYLCIRDVCDPMRPELDELRQRHMRQVVTHLQALADLRLVGSTLDAISVPWVVVKGPVLAEVYWRRPDARHYGDLDVVVAPSALPAALDALMAAGAHLLDVNWGMILRRMRGELSLRLPAGTVLDLHWHVVNEVEVRRRFNFDMDAMFARRRFVPLGPSHVPTWDACDSVFHVAYHAAASGAHRLVWLKDLALCLADPTLDWDDLLRRARHVGVDAVLAATASRAGRVLDVPLPQEIRHQLRHQAPWLVLTAAADRLAPPVHQPRTGPSGRAVYQSLRGTLPATASAFAHAIPTVVQARREHTPTGTDNALWHADGDDAARREFLRRVSAQQG